MVSTLTECVWIKNAPSSKANVCKVLTVLSGASSIMACISNPADFWIAKLGCWKSLKKDRPNPAKAFNNQSKFSPLVVSENGGQTENVKKSRSAAMTRAPELRSQLSFNFANNCSRNFSEDRRDDLLSCSWRKSALSCMGHIRAAKQSTAAQRIASSSDFKA